MTYIERTANMLWNGIHKTGGWNTESILAHYDLITNTSMYNRTPDINDMIVEAVESELDRLAE